MTETMRSLQNDFRAMSEDFQRTFAAARPSLTVRVGNGNTNVAAPRPAPTPDPRPAPTPAVPVTPKSAIDRVLENDLIPEDDVGVKPES
jgi:hypothetical protein